MSTETLLKNYAVLLEHCFVLNDSKFIFLEETTCFSFL